MKDNLPVKRSFLLNHEDCFPSMCGINKVFQQTLLKGDFYDSQCLLQETAKSVPGTFPLLGQNEELEYIPFVSH